MPILKWVLKYEYKYLITHKSNNTNIIRDEKSKYLRKKVSCAWMSKRPSHDFHVKIKLLVIQKFGMETCASTSHHKPVTALLALHVFSHHSHMQSDLIIQDPNFVFFFFVTKFFSFIKIFLKNPLPFYKYGLVSR